jgi:hypothetical protein
MEGALGVSMVAGGGRLKGRFREEIYKMGNLGGQGGRNAQGEATE